MSVTGRHNKIHVISVFEQEIDEVLGMQIWCIKNKKARTKSGALDNTGVYECKNGKQVGKFCVMATIG